MSALKRLTKPWSSSRVSEAGSWPPSKRLYTPVVEISIDNITYMFFLSFFLYLLLSIISTKQNDLTVIKNWWNHIDDTFKKRSFYSIFFFLQKAVTVLKTKRKKIYIVVKVILWHRNSTSWCSDFHLALLFFTVIISFCNRQGTCKQKLTKLCFKQAVIPIQLLFFLHNIPIQLENAFS